MELHITEVVLHKDFNFTQQINDIALLKTSMYMIKHFQQKHYHSCFQENKLTCLSLPLHVFLCLVKALPAQMEE